MPDIKKLTQQFAINLHGALDQMVEQRARELVIGIIDRASVGTPPKPVRPAEIEKPRRKPPRQLCPIPDCKASAAPIYNMLCHSHKDTAPKKVAQFRKARRLAKKLKIPISDLLKDWEKYRRQAN